MKHGDYHIGWVCALPTERAAAVCLLDEPHDPLPQPITDDNNYELGRIRGHNIAIACLPAGLIGITSAARVAEQMRSTFTSIRFCLMVGIGGGVPSEEHDVRLGDVVVSKPVNAYPGVVQYDVGKTVQNGRFVRTGSLNRPPDVLLNAVSSLQARHLYEESRIPRILAETLTRFPLRQQAHTYPGSSFDRLFQWTYNHPVGEDTCDKCDSRQLIVRRARQHNKPIVHYGLVASGNRVMRDGVTREKLRRHLDVLCFEMEAAGLMDSFPCLIIRGICDYADSHKHKQWQDYAAATAAAYAKELLEVVPANPAMVTPLTSGPSKGRHFMVYKGISRKHIVRLDLLHQLQRFLSPEHLNPGAGKKVALIGMSGSGKTEVAAWFAMEQRQNYEAIFWLDCSSEKNLNNSFMRIAAQLTQKPFQDFCTSRLLFQDWLCFHDGWFLIMDSLDDDKILQDLDSEFLSVGMTGDVLATSTNFDLAITWNSVEVGKMSHQETLDLLHKILADSSSRPGNEDHELILVARQLGFLALAIDQCGHYMRQTALTARDYKKLLESQPSGSSHQELLIPSFPCHASRLWTAYELSFQRLQETDWQASQLLFLLTVLRSENTELELLLSREHFQGHWGENGDFQEVSPDQRWIPHGMESIFFRRHLLLERVANLRRFAFVQLNDDNMSVSLHPLIQRWVLHIMEQQEGLVDRFKICAIGVVCSRLYKQDLFPPYVVQGNSGLGIEERGLLSWPWRKYHDLSRHALLCLQFVCDLSLTSCTAACQSLALLQFLEFTSCGDYSEHIDFGRRVMASVQRALGQQVSDSDGFLLVSLNLWQIIRARSCDCQKSRRRHCPECSMAYRTAREITRDDSDTGGVAILGIDLSRRTVRRTCRVLASIQCLKRLTDGESLHSTAIQVGMSWIERYLVAVATFELCCLQNNWLSNDPEKYKRHLTEAVETFKQLGGSVPDEYRRSLWHLSTYWWNLGAWPTIIEALQPLIEDSLRQPTSDWSHERCIIRVAASLLKLQKHNEASEMLAMVETAYKAAGQSLRTIQNSTLLDPCQSGHMAEVSRCAGGFLET
jgi:nucleoside phosphorylase